MIYLPVTLLLFLLFLLLFPFIWFAIALDVVEVAVNSMNAQKYALYNAQGILLRHLNRASCASNGAIEFPSN